jgi:hypothetical protein
MLNDRRPDKFAAIFLSDQNPIRRVVRGRKGIAMGGRPGIGPIGANLTRTMQFVAAPSQGVSEFFENFVAK